MSRLKPCPFCGSKAYFKSDVKISCEECSAVMGGVQGKEELARVWNTRAAPKVKRLLWENPCKDNNYIHIARTLFGDYGIHICGGRHMAWIEKNVKPYEEFIGDEVGSVPEAKAAAQSHYEKQILEALE